MSNDMLKKLADTVRGLSIDAVQKANSGHPGLPMGMADVAAVLFSEQLRFNPKNPNWFNRDRFVLSGGHGSMLLYSLLHLFGYSLSIDDLKSFRQWHSKTPGHPERQDTEGVETTTGPLGQGIANAVGMAIAETMLAARFNTKSELINHYTYVMLGDGDLQEGVSHEASAFAGHHKLNKLIAFYDSNSITIDGDTSISFTENTRMRFEAYHWNVLEIDGHNTNEIREAINKAKQETCKPTIIICKTIIGFGSPNKQGTHHVHGAPLGADEVILTKKNLGLPLDEFYVPAEVYSFGREVAFKGFTAENEWNLKVEQMGKSHPDVYQQLQDAMQNKLPQVEFPYFDMGTKVATRVASGKVLSAIAPQIPGLVGGSADLTPSNNTKADSQKAYTPENRGGTYIHYGIREFGMGAILNGMALHGGIIPYGGTFFVFSDYMRSSIRMAALMGLRVIYVFTHDSIGLGEDGSTHQPVEHLASLRAIPNLLTFRPMDANETSVAWQMALNNTNGPTALVLTRQNLTVVTRDGEKVAFCTDAKKGGYILTEDKDFDIILMASGSEVEIALEAKKQMNENGRKVRIVSMLSTELFDQQPEEYKKSVLPKGITRRIAIEAASAMSWYKYVGLNGKTITLDRFGASAPIDVLYKEFGITAEVVVKTAERMFVFHENCN
jgi:transketolase